MSASRRTRFYSRYNDVTMKALVLLLCLLQSPGILTSGQILSWRSYYAESLDKDVSESLKTLGEPSTVNGVTRQWNPSAKTQFRTVFLETSPARIVLRVTVYPREGESMPVTELLHSPEKYILSTGVKPKLGSYLQADTKDRTTSLLFLCAPDHDPQLGWVMFKSTKSPDPEVE